MTTSATRAGEAGVTDVLYAWRLLVQLDQAFVQQFTIIKVQMKFVIFMFVSAAYGTGLCNPTMSLVISVHIYH